MDKFDEIKLRWESIKDKMTVPVMGLSNEDVDWMISEIDKLKDTQLKLIQLLQKADEHSDKQEWKLFWETKDKFIDEWIKNRSPK